MWEQYFSGRNKYQLIRSLGSGAVSEVYLVKCYEDGKEYAMKTANKELLRQESDILMRLKYPTLPEWKEYFEDEQGYLMLEYIEGITLQQWIEKQGKASVREAVYIIGEILQTLQFLHSQSPPIIYCDIKPSNIMVERSGKIRMIDLGGAVRSRYKVGTYGYAAPEQFWEGVRPGPAWDIYAVGKLLTFLLTGKDPCLPPYDMLQFCEKDKRITPQMYAVIQRSIAVNSLGRYASAEEFDKALQSAVGKKGLSRRISGYKKEKIQYEKCVWKSEYRRI